MKEIKKKHLSFLMNDDEERAAWEKLQRMDHNASTSCSRYVSRAINAYNDMDNPHDRKVASEIISGFIVPLSEIIYAAVDKAMAKYSMGKGTTSNQDDERNPDNYNSEGNQETDSDTTEDFIDWDFLNGA